MRRRPHVLPNILKDKILTGFELQVYRVVLRIPRGQVRSYRWVAAKIGKPRASRAVGNALNKNPYIGIVPCHRVIRSDGLIGGFAKGVMLKKRMLAREGVDLNRLGLL